MGVQADHEEEREVMSVPERFEALSSNFLVGGAVPVMIVWDVSGLPAHVIATAYIKTMMSRRT